MKKLEFVSANITDGGKKVGELLVSVELADCIRFDPNFPDEPEITIGHFKANLSKTARMVEVTNRK